MSFFGDLLPILRKTPVTFVKSKGEIGNVVSFYFKAEKAIPWTAGQHGIISVPGKLQGGNWRGFSIASTPQDDLFMISTRILDNPSQFKQALISLKPGDQVNMRGPFGPFYLDGSRRPVVFIAGGIGITPFRSLILGAARTPGSAPESVSLIYSDERHEYCYRSDFEAIAQTNPFLHQVYTDRNNLSLNLKAAVEEYGNDAHYYISGSGKMVKAIKGELKALGIVSRNVKNELFIGL